MLWRAIHQGGSVERVHGPQADETKENELMNQIIWIVGLVVIVLFILGYFGLR